ncbi:hypothetical protein ABE021_14255 [Sporosarcina gallistercoris]|uniref:hypothetical protein n=1 Tax=Sporosarcina gallistercoris TaxID=2762245 RepID=UPI003D2B8BDA
MAERLLIIEDEESIALVLSAKGDFSLIEIEIDVEGVPDQVTYQIHAVSGKVMAVTWDD